MPWIDEEFGALASGDVRHTHRLLRLVAAWWGRLAGSVARACQGWAEQMAAYRLFASPRITLAVILAPHQAATRARVQAEPVVLDIQDTTVLDYTGKPIARTPGAVGPLTYDGQRGLLAHIRLLVTPDHRPLGVALVTLWARTVLQAVTQTRSNKRRLLADKESARWLTGYQQACAVATDAPDTQVISIADREGDLYEVYQAAVTAADAADGRRAAWLVRACQDRAVIVGDGTRTRSLRLQLALAPCVGLATVAVPAGPGRAARTATCTVRVATVTLRPPWRPGGVRLAPVAVTVVAVRESAPPSATDRLEWVLLTSLPVTTVPDVQRVIGYYACRWEIEVFFRLLKSGCQVEALPFQTRARLEPCLGLCLVLAWRLHAVTRLGQQTPTAPCTVALADAEWRVLALLVTRQPPPRVPPSLGQAVRWLAQLGGFAGRTGDGDPGPLTLWRGWQRIQEAVTLQRLYEEQGKCV